jgi:iron complex outermembrane recepter protein
MPIDPSRHALVRRPLVHAAFFLTLAGQAQAQQTLQTIEVTGQAAAPVSPTNVTENIEAAPASVTILTRRDLDKLSISTYGDLFRNVPGMHVNDLGQGLVAYEIKVRGFLGDHSRDIAFYLDGLPLNITGSRRTNGYADLAQLIPETVDRVEIVRGPFDVAAGNHAVAGSVRFYTDRNTPSQIKLDVDSFGRTRLLPVWSADAGPGRVLFALDATKGPAYQEQSEIRRLNALLRYSVPLGAGQLSLRMQGYDAAADAPGYLPLASVRSGAINPKSALSPGIGDDKRQHNLIVNYRSDDAEGASGWGGGWQASLYAVRDDRIRWANFDLTTPIGEARNLGRDADDLRQLGFEARKATLLGSTTQVQLGVQFTDERIESMTSRTDADRNSLGDAQVMAQRDVMTQTMSAFGQVQFALLYSVKLTAGARYDRLAFDVDLRPLDDFFGRYVGNSFSNTKGQLSPKLGVGWAIVKGESPLELFANAARGLKSPYPYGDFARLPTANITPLTSVEAGLQGRNGALSWRAALWRTVQDNEALFDAADQLLGIRRTERQGYDLGGRLLLGPDLRLQADYSGVRARIRDAGANDRVTGVPEWIAHLGIEGVLTLPSSRIDWSLSDALVGPTAVTIENSIRTRRYQRVTARLGYAHASLKGARFTLALTNYDRPFEETQVRLGGRTGVLAKPRLKALGTAQWVF